MEFRALNADEIECRVSTVSAKGCSLLLYKDSRADMILLDETVGPMNWQRSHLRENANCIVSIWDETKSQWISKEDTGTESYTEKEKGLASDSFKRACFNWGIGRELYTAPFIWIQAKDANLSESEDKKKYTTYERFKVDSITYDGKKIIGVVIANAKSGAVCYKLIPPKGTPKTEQKKNTAKTEPTEEEVSKIQEDISKKKIDPIKVSVIKKELIRTGVTEKALCSRYGIGKIEEITEGIFSKVVNALSATKDKLSSK